MCLLDLDMLVGFGWVVANEQRELYQSWENSKWTSAWYRYIDRQRPSWLIIQVSFCRRDCRASAVWLSNRRFIDVPVRVAKHTAAFPFQMFFVCFLSIRLNANAATHLSATQWVYPQCLQPAVMSCAYTLLLLQFWSKFGWIRLCLSLVSNTKSLYQQSESRLLDSFTARYKNLWTTPFSDDVPALMLASTVLWVENICVVLHRQSLARVSASCASLVSPLVTQV